MIKANRDLRQALNDAEIPMWRLGLAWGCNEQTVIRRFRCEMEPERKQEVYALIEQIKKERMN